MPLTGDLEVVDLLPPIRRSAFAVAGLVVLVRRVRGPVSARGQHFAHQQLVGVEGVRQAVVVDLAGAVARAAQFHGDVLLGPVSCGRPPRGFGGGQREQASCRADHRLGIPWQVSEIGGLLEHRGTPGQFEGLAVVVDRAAARQRQHQGFGVAGGRSWARRSSSSTRRPEYPQPADSGVTTSSNGPSAVLPPSRCNFLIATPLLCRRPWRRLRRAGRAATGRPPGPARSAARARPRRRRRRPDP